MITPRVTRLLRVPDLRALQRTVVDAIPRDLSARRVGVILPSRSAAEELRRRIEDITLASSDAACVIADLFTRTELYVRLHARLAGAPPLLTEFEREVLLRLAADDASGEGAPAPFRLRPGLVAAVLGFYDELRRRGRSIDVFDRVAREKLEPGMETDRGAARLFEQTRFLAAAFAAFERRIADSGRIDEHALRTLLLSSPAPPAYRHIIVAVADQAADEHGLWPVDFDLLSRINGLERLDIVVTERMLATGLHERLHDALPGIDEAFVASTSVPPVLLTPPAEGADEPLTHFVCRDREEELVEAARWIKLRARNADIPVVLDRIAVVFHRPLPYLYLARQVFTSATIPYQAMDALPLAAEPFAAAIDLIFAVASEEGTRTALVELLASPHWNFLGESAGGDLAARGSVAALDRVLQESKYLGGWDRLGEIAASIETRTRGTSREAERWRRAAPAIAASIALGAELDTMRTGPSASAQLEVLLGFVRRHERPPATEQPEDGHARARAAILGAIASLRDAHARYDNRPLPITELIATIHRWIEGQTFSPRTGDRGVLLVDAAAAAFTEADAVRIVGLVESDWPERTSGSIFYPAALLRDLGWPAEYDRLAAARARFLDLLFLPTQQASISSFTLEDDALVPPSAFLEEVTSAGLAIERAPRPPFTRVFAHEALSMAPVVADALPAHARDWLSLRLARTPAIDPRYRGVVAPRPPGIYAVSRIERYLECPFKYFAGQVLQLEEEREDESGLTPQERGQLLHGVFEAFFAAWGERGRTRITAESLGDAVALFAEVAETELAGLPEADRALERTYLLGSAASPGLAERAFAFEIEHGIDVVERLLEHEFAGAFMFEGPAGPRQVRMRGKADRIDLLEDGTLRVIDYKLGRAPKPARSLQLPIYGVCAQQDLDGRHGRTWTLGRAGYVAFREKNAFVELGGRGGNLDAALADGQQRFLDAVARIEAGDFPVDPDEPWMCTRCGFPHVCRKDYVGDE